MISRKPRKKQADWEAEQSQLNDKISLLEEELATAKKEIEERDSQITEYQREAEDRQTKHAGLTIQFSKLKEDKQALEKKLDAQEVKMLASSFEDTEVKYKEEVFIWSKWLFLVTSLSLFIIIVALALFDYLDLPLRSRLSFYAVSGILIYAIIFCSKQYSFYRNLMVDMRHRKTLAQSYYNILRSVEDEPIKARLAEEVIKFITTPPHTKEDKMNTPLEIISDVVSKQK